MPTNSEDDALVAGPALPPPPGMAEQIGPMFGGPGQMEGFRPDAWAAFVEYRLQFTRDLATQAEELARGRDGTAIDRGDVKAAHDKVRPKPGGLDRWTVIFNVCLFILAAVITMFVTRAVVPDSAVPHPNIWDTSEIAGVVLAFGGFVWLTVRWRQK